MANLELLEYAYSVVERAPADRFDLSRWQAKRFPVNRPPTGVYHAYSEPDALCRTRTDFDHACGALACGGGLLSMDPKFIELGIGQTAYGTPLDSHVEDRGDGRRLGHNAFVRVFDISEADAEVLFETASPNVAGSLDWDFYDERKLTSTHLDIYDETIRYIDPALHRDLWLYRCRRLIDLLRAKEESNA
jgi:hypothetical protein